MATSLGPSSTDPTWKCHRERRLTKELRSVHTLDRWSPSDQHALFAVRANDLSHWSAWLAGPADSPYCGGVWELSINFPNNYPIDPPTIKFLTPVYHPLVCQSTGKIKLDLLDSSWSPALSARVILVVLHSMLGDIRAEDYDAKCWADHQQMQSLMRSLVSDRDAFDQTARVWTRTRAAYTMVDPRSSPATHSRARFLLWLAMQIETMHGLPGTGIWAAWVEGVLPLCVLGESSP